MLMEASAVNLVSLNKKCTRPTVTKTFVKSTSLKTRRVKIRRARVQKSDLMRLVTKGLNRKRATDHHSLLL